MKVNKLHFFLVILLSAFLLSCNTQGNRNQDEDNDSISMSENTGTDMGMDDEKDDDSEFMQKAAYSSLLEIELGRYAQQNAVNSRVKNFGAMMVRDHSKANDQLKALAAKKNIAIPATLDQEHMDKMNEIKEKKGSEFDKEYISRMVDEHQKDTDMFRRHSENGEDQELRDFAGKTLPVLITHQDSARKINDAIK